MFPTLFFPSCLSSISLMFYYFICLFENDNCCWYLRYLYIQAEDDVGGWCCCLWCETGREKKWSIPWTEGRRDSIFSFFCCWVGCASADDDRQRNDATQIDNQEREQEQILIGYCIYRSRQEKGEIRIKIK